MTKFHSLTITILISFPAEERNEGKFCLPSRRQHKVEQEEEGNNKIVTEYSKHHIFKSSHPPLSYSTTQLPVSYENEED